jgi:hypothetical protein
LCSAGAGVVWHGTSMSLAVTPSRSIQTYATSVQNVREYLKGQPLVEILPATFSGGGVSSGQLGGLWNVSASLL